MDRKQDVHFWLGWCEGALKNIRRIAQDHESHADPDWREIHDVVVNTLNRLTEEYRDG